MYLLVPWDNIGAANGSLVDGFQVQNPSEKTMREVSLPKDWRLLAFHLTSVQSDRHCLVLYAV